MNNVIAAAFLSLSVASSALAGVGQQATETSKPKSASQNNLTNSESIAKSDLNTRTAKDDAADNQKRYESAMALTEAGRFDEAINAFKELLKLQPQDPQVHFGMGMTYSRTKDYKDALESFKKATRLKPDWADAHFRYGVTSYVLGKKEQATEEYKRLLEMKSSLANVLYRIIRDEATAESIDDHTEPPVSDPKPTAAPTPRIEPAASAPHPIAPAATLADVYRVGLGDILDIRFLNSPNGGRSTLFTVVAGGMIDFPIAGGSIMVAGLTTDEIQTKIEAELKRRAIEEKAQLSVGVRQFGSHSVMVTGLVASLGSRTLRREAVPLYVVLAEAQVRNDAGRISILRNGSVFQTLDLNDPLAMNATVINGDVITVTGRPQEFYYIAGRINYPGQKNFQAGITLLQAILAAGGITRQNEGMVEISREGTDGRLVTTLYNLKEIKAGRVGDPKVQAGDRIEVIR
ncbi:MAG TPA: tetratricopeptide repeat protein [Pyrinomonadaceae bacterium]